MNLRALVSDSIPMCLSMKQIGYKFNAFLPFVGTLCFHPSFSVNQAGTPPCCRKFFS
ncbi:MAG: hypothetical protein H6Q14_1847 [Bacteroidetes bacterium]|nr:hypothetical protein [Bacteroidota bacterium]